jgi:hypothetical protein
MRRKGVAAILGIAAIALPVAVAQAAESAPNPGSFSHGGLDGAYNIYKLECFPSVNTMTRANVLLTMTTVNRKFNWKKPATANDSAEYMSATARLEESGFGWKTGDWASWKTPYLGTGTHKYLIRLTTDNTGNRTVLHVRLKWHRVGKNVVKNVYLTHTAACSGDFDPSRYAPWQREIGGNGRDISPKKPTPRRRGGGQNLPAAPALPATNGGDGVIIAS